MAVGNSKSGQLLNPAGGNCTGAAINGDISIIDCPVLGNSASANYKTTMQPGDNFAVTASLVETYRNHIVIDTNAGGNLINATNQIIPISLEANPNNVQGIRTRMLTVWRKLHIEVDSMDNVGSGNNVTGRINSKTQTICPRTPTTPPCVTSTAYIVTYDTGMSVDSRRFDNGRININSKDFDVSSNQIINGDQVIILKGNPPFSGKVKQNDSFTLYDDDDYNADDTQLDGDNNEPIVRLPESFRYLSAVDGNYPDMKPRNLYASAYIMPEYNWAEIKGYNQTNIAFRLNIASDNNQDTIINANRNSRADERDGFWIAYFLIAYQEDTKEDADGAVFNNQTQMFDFDPGVSGTGRSPTVGCDCYQSATCVGTICPTVSQNGMSSVIIPRGAFGSLIFQEVMQDVTRSWFRDGNLVIENQGTTAPHELGHQFGLRGDNQDSITGSSTRSFTYRIMDYPHYPMETDEYSFHPEHINIIRKRVKSPGE